MTRLLLDFFHVRRDIALMAGHDGYTRYTVRIPTPLYERVKKAAGEKSVNAEIVETLEQTYPAPAPRKLVEEVTAFLESLPSRYDSLDDPERKRQLIEGLLTIMVEHGDIDTQAMVDYIMKDFDPSLSISENLPKVKEPDEAQTGQKKFFDDKSDSDSEGDPELDQLPQNDGPRMG